MSTIKSSNEHLTINADGSSKDIKFQANGVEKASISSSGAFTSTTIDATKLTGDLPAISGECFPNGMHTRMCYKQHGASRRQNVLRRHGEFPSHLYLCLGLGGHNFRENYFQPLRGASYPR